MDEEDFEYCDSSFDIFQEIVFKNKVVGYVSYMEEDYGYILVESYIMPEFRKHKLLYKEIVSKINLDISVFY